MVEHVVLFSGGYESTGCLIKALEAAGGDASKVSAIFFDYDQPYLGREYLAVKRLAQHFGVALSIKQVNITYWMMANKKNTRVYDHRNRTFLIEAHLQEPGAMVWFGCRAPWYLGDAYGDSNRQFAREVAEKYQFKVATPFIWYPKFLVRSVVKKAGVGRVVFSSENYQYE